MKSYEVIGTEEVDYTSKKTNRQVTGRRLHLVFDFDQNMAGFVGNGVEVVFTNLDTAKNIKVGDTVELLYNKFGSICDIRKL